MATSPSIDSMPASAARTDGEIAFELGMAFSSGSGGCPVDLVQAHRWLNVAALLGNRTAQSWRAEVAAEMSGTEVVEAQRLARATLATIERKAA